LSGLTAYYVGENTAITESNKKWNTVSLVAKKLAVLAKYSSELAEDSIISMADDLANESAYAFSLQEDQAGFLGDGTSTYGGITGLEVAILAATASQVDAASGNTAFSTLDLADFEGVVGKLPQFAEAGAKWFISKAGWAASMLRLIDSAGGNTGAMIAGTAPKEFLGYPVVISQVLNSELAADVDAIKCTLGNLRLAATMGDRRGITVKTSEHRFIELDQFAVQVTERFDINVHDVGTTAVVGPMVALVAASS
jgi:HK97 family phage major capsid protein